MACSLCGINRQVYYRENTRKLQSQCIATKVVELVKEVRRVIPRIGTRKLYYKLESNLKGLGVGRDKLFSILRANKLLISKKKRFHITTDSDHPFYKFPNIVKDLEITGPNQVWVSDITYIGSREKPCYLSLITDVYSKKIVGYNVSNSFSLEGASSALKLAIQQNKSKIDGIIHHSDRGLQYYQKLLKSKAIRCSMTNNGDLYENAIAERVNGILKQEFAIDTYNQELLIMKKIINQVVDIYNNYRPHDSNYLLTPSQMFTTRNQKFKTYKKMVVN